MLNTIINRLQYLQWSSRYKSYRKKYNINDAFIFNGPDIRFYGPGDIVIRPESHIGSYSTIQASNGSVVTIGKNCRISHNVRIYTKSEIADQDFSKDDLSKKKGDVTIGDHVWIGVNTYVGPNVIIGENSVVSANSVVTRNIPKNCIASGNPAKVIQNKNME